jgi:hypothetical protein
MLIGPIIVSLNLAQPLFHYIWPASFTLFKVYSQGYCFSDAPTLAESLAVYLKFKGIGRSEYFMTTARINSDYVVTCLETGPIDQYTSLDTAE